MPDTGPDAPEPLAMEHVSLGVPLGARWSDGNDDQSAPVRMRLGPAVVDVPAALYDAWVMQRATGLDPTAERPSIVKLRRLEELGLLLRCPPEPERLRQRLDPLVLTSSGIGAGNSPERPEAFVIISQAQQPLAIVNAVVYEVWARAGGGATVSSACAAAATEVGDIGQVRDVFVQALPALLACAVLFLEPSGGRRA